MTGKSIRIKKLHQGDTPCSKAMILAAYDSFQRKDKLGSDLYLETREKEDEFLAEVLKTIWRGLRDNTEASVRQILPSSDAGPSEDDANAALDFSESF